MEQFNYHKLVNLKKRFDKYDCECADELKAVIDKHLAIQKAISDKKTQKKKDAYQSEAVECPYCDKEVMRYNFYKHKKACPENPQKKKKN